MAPCPEVQKLRIPAQWTTCDLCFVLGTVKILERLRAFHGKSLWDLQYQLEVSVIRVTLSWSRSRKWILFCYFIKTYCNESVSSWLTYPSLLALINIQIFDIEHLHYIALHYITGSWLTHLSLPRMHIQSLINLINSYSSLRSQVKVTVCIKFSRMCEKSSFSQNILKIILYWILQWNGKPEGL